MSPYFKHEVHKIFLKINSKFGKTVQKQKAIYRFLIQEAFLDDCNVENGEELNKQGIDNLLPCEPPT